MPFTFMKIVSIVQEQSNYKKEMQHYLLAWYYSVQINFTLYIVEDPKFVNVHHRSLPKVPSNRCLKESAPSSSKDADIKV